VAQEGGLKCEVLGRAQIEKLGMNLFLGVAQGSAEEPRLVRLSYEPARKGGKPVALVGKAITFDSGGLSLKTAQGMEDMKTDMAGAATVLSAIGAVAALELPVEVHAIAACTENMPSGKAYKLGDVLRSMAGKTVEINNTDAEGRLTLGDALAFALKLSPDEVFDFFSQRGFALQKLRTVRGDLGCNEYVFRRITE
jgi:leucyl aminopeptidase